MKTFLKYLILLAGLLVSVDSFAQIPQGINYQAIIRNSSTGLPVANKAIKVRFEIDTVAPGPLNRAYWEEHNTATNDYGLINLVIGKNKVDSSGLFSSIPWTKLTWLRLLVDTNGGTAFSTVGTTQFFAVPYAMNAGNVDKIGIRTDANTITGDGTQAAPLKQTDLGIGAGVMGSSSMIPVINYDTYGRIVSISQTTITASPVLTNTLNIVGDGSTQPLDLSSKSIGTGTVGATNIIPVIGYDDKGRITSVSTASVTVVPIIVDTAFFNGDGTVGAPLRFKSMGTGTGSVGSSTVIPVIDYDDYGRITNIDTVHLSQLGAVGTGTINFVSKYKSSSTIGSSGIYENNIGNIMIGGTSPQAGLHIKKFGGILSQGELDSGIVSTLGPGVRMHWYPRKAAFRTGGVSSTQWDETNIGKYSVAMGDNPTASQVNTIAFGQSAKAVAKDAVAIGNGSMANKLASFALGGAVVSGDNSLGYGNLTNIAAGTNNISLGTSNNSGTNASSTYIFGQGNEVDASNVISIGSNTIAATNSGAFGSDNDISGSGFSFAFGEKNLITDQFNYLLGINNEVKVGAKNVFLFGEGNISEAQQSVVVGMFNDIGKTSTGSVVMGMYNTVSSGNTNSFSFGRDNSNIGVGSISLGVNNSMEANSDFSTAVGRTNRTFSNATYIFGDANYLGATSNSSYVVGSNNFVNAGSESSYLVGERNRQNAFASRGSYLFGKLNTVTDGADFVYAVGEGNSLGGNRSYAFGFSNASLVNTANVWMIGHSLQVSGGSVNNTWLMGESLGSTASGNVTIGIGAGGGLINNEVNSLMVGFYSDVPTFFVGKAAGPGTYGKVGIATSTPAERLHVTGSSASEKILVENTNNSGSAIFKATNGIRSLTMTQFGFTGSVFTSRRPADTFLSRVEQVNGSGLEIEPSNNSSLYLTVNDTTRLKVSKKGYIGVGDMIADDDFHSTLQIKGSVAQSVYVLGLGLALTLNDQYSVVLVKDPGSTITLPLANSCRGRIYTIKKNFAGAGGFTLSCQGANNLDNSIAFKFFSTDWQTVKVISDGVNGWAILQE